MNRIHNQDAQSSAALASTHREGPEWPCGAFLVSGSALSALSRCRVKQAPMRVHLRVDTCVWIAGTGFEETTRRNLNLGLSEAQTALRSLSHHANRQKVWMLARISEVPVLVQTPSTCLCIHACGVHVQRCCCAFARARMHVHRCMSAS